MGDLKNCPFCNAPMRIEYDSTREMYGPTGDHVPGCFLINQDARDYAYRKDAVAVWNARATAQPERGGDEAEGVVKPKAPDAAEVVVIPMSVWVAMTKQYSTAFYVRPTAEQEGGGVMADRSMNAILARVEKGQKFNAYDLTGGGYVIGIGPVNDCLQMARTSSAAAANLIVDALRANNGQPPAAAAVGDPS